MVTELQSEALATLGRIETLLKQAGAKGLTRNKIRDRLSQKQRTFQQLVYDYLVETGKVAAYNEKLNDSNFTIRYVWAVPDTKEILEEPVDSVPKVTVTKPHMPEIKSVARSRPGTVTTDKKKSVVARKPVDPRVANAAVHLIIALDKHGGMVPQTQTLLALRGRGFDDDIIRQAFSLLRLRIARRDDEVYWRWVIGA